MTTKTDFYEKCVLDFFGTKEAPKIPYHFEDMSNLAKNIVERSIVVPEVQPKLSMSLVTNIEIEDAPRLNALGALGGHYIFKAPTPHFKEMSENEHLTMRIAEAFSLNVVPSSLIRLTSGELAYITIRMNRTAKEKKHICWISFK